MINEAFKSSKLAKLAKENGGVAILRDNGERDCAIACLRGRQLNASEIPDEMVGDEILTPEGKKESNSYIEFNNGKMYALKAPKDLDNLRPIVVDRRQHSRYRSGIGDTGDHNKFEQGHTKSAPYDGYMSSDRAGNSQHVRYLKKYWGDDYDKQVVNKPTPEQIKTIGGRHKMGENRNSIKKTISESMLKQIVSESIKKVIKEEKEQFSSCKRYNVNPNDCEVYSRSYDIEIFKFGGITAKFMAYANDEMGALEAVADFIERKGWGLLADDDELRFEYPDEYIELGNGHYLRSDFVSIKQVK